MPVMSRKRKLEEDSHDPPQAKKRRIRKVFEMYSKIGYKADVCHSLYSHVPNEITDFQDLVAKELVSLLNTKGGILCFGVRSGCVYGTSISRREEDVLKCIIDGVIKKIHPILKPEMLRVTFTPVMGRGMDARCSVLEVRVQKGDPFVLYETGGEAKVGRNMSQVFLREGSKISPPLIPQQIMKHTCRLLKEKLKHQAALAEKLSMENPIPPLNHSNNAKQPTTSCSSKHTTSASAAHSIMTPSKQNVKTSNVPPVASAQKTGPVTRASVNKSALYLPSGSAVCSSKPPKPPSTVKQDSTSSKPPSSAKPKITAAKPPLPKLLSTVKPIPKASSTPEKPKSNSGTSVSDANKPDPSSSAKSASASTSPPVVIDLTLSPLQPTVSAKPATIPAKPPPPKVPSSVKKNGQTPSKDTSTSKPNSNIAKVAPSKNFAPAKPNTAATKPLPIKAPCAMKPTTKQPAVSEPQAPSTLKACATHHAKQPPRAPFAVRSANIPAKPPPPKAPSMIKPNTSNYPPRPYLPPSWEQPHFHYPVSTASYGHHNHGYMYTQTAVHHTTYSGYSHHSQYPHGPPQQPPIYNAHPTYNTHHHDGYYATGGDSQWQNGRRHGWNWYGQH